MKRRPRSDNWSDQSSIHPVISRAHRAALAAAHTPAMSFLPVKRVRLPDQVAESIRDAIVGGRYEPGDALPAERTLADQFGVNRSSVREAIRRLESWGMVVVRHGGGTRVADFLATANMQVLPFLIAPKGELDVGLLYDLLELRVELLDWTARRAAARATPADTAELEQKLVRLDAAQSVAEIQEADFEFFERLVSISGNRVLNLLIHAVRRVYLQNRELFHQLYDGQQFSSAALWEAFAAIRDNDTEAAGAALRRYGLAMIPEVRP